MSTDVVSIAGKLEFSRVQFFEISAKLLELNGSTKDGLSAESAESKEPVDVQIGVRNEEGEVGLRVTLELLDRRVMTRIDCAAFFRKLDPKTDLEPASIRGFIQYVALPLLVPYIRETLADISRRVTGKALTLGLIRTDELSLVDES